MELIFIGTSSGKTNLNRFHSSLLFRNKKRKILIDAGDGISKALLNQNIEINSITDIIFSHFHSDHLAGLPSLLTQMIISKRKEPLKIYTHQKLVKQLILFLNISYIFIEKLNYQISIIPFNFLEQTLIDEEFNFTSKQNIHITNKHNISGNNIEFISSSFLFNIKEKKVIYTSDVGSAEDLNLFAENNIELFITETTHIHYSELLPVIDDKNPKQTILTHIEDEISLLEWFDTLSESDKGKIKIAVDGMRISI